MKKTLLILFFISALISSSYAGSESRSIYTEKMNDPEAVYFTPENFGITADGKADVSEPLQAAINQVKDRYNFGIVFIPEGKYRINKTIYIPKAVRVIGYGEKRPQIILSKNSPGYQQEVTEDKGKANYMFWFTDAVVREGSTPKDANPGTFYSAISNIDLKIEDGNPYAVGLRTHFAQHCFVSNMDIHIGKGKAGLYDVGNMMENVRFFGGEYGIYTTKTSPSWQMMMLDLYFEGQSKAAIKTQEGGLTIIRLHAKNTPVVIEVEPERSDKIYMEDCTFEQIRKAGIIISNEDYSPNQLSMQNIYCNQVPVFVEFRESSKQIAGKGNNYHVKEFSHGLHIKDMAAKAEHKTIVEIVPLSKKPELPLCDIPALPSMKQWVNIRDLGAKGDGESDDTEIFQKAIEEHEVIYIPQGWYIISEPLKLKDKTCLIGLSPISTQLKLKESTPAFSGFGTPQPLVESSVGGNNIVTGIGLNTGAYNYRAVGCKWMAGEGSYLDDIKFLGVHGTMDKIPVRNQSETRSTPKISTPEEPITYMGMDKAWDNQYWSLWVTNNGGGTIKNIWSASSYSTNGLYVNNTSTPGRIYAMSVEHHVRNEVRIKNVSNWKFYALQLEEETRESPDCQPIELENCNNLFFANLYLFRVVWIKTPMPYAIRTWNCRNIEFYNVHNFTQMRFTIDLVMYDINTKQDVRPWEFTRLTITGNEPQKTICENKDEVKKLATGFEYAEGITRDSKGNVYFSEQRMRRIYKWDVETERLSLIADFPWEPLSLACDTKDQLLVIFRYNPQPGYLIDGKQETVKSLPDASGTTFSHWGNTGFSMRVYSIDPNNPEKSIQELQKRPMSSVNKIAKAIYPAHRWRDLHDFNTVSTWIPKSCFIATDSVTLIPEYYDFLRSSSALEAIPGQPLYASDEYNRITSKMDVQNDGTLTNICRFTNQGEFGSAVDKNGNVYIADGYIYVYNKNAERIRVIDIPERPTAMVIAGKNNNTLFVAARSSLYMYNISK
ncbi:glycosyl hydrolase family 28-related protein [Massilibacteroides vaginae]|uniref:glycosyl hydrolase family 28-related protein n=1 Tax=Massilibacteroides vaginae TaxID=1673718 RepID=UPI000A1CAC6B|nr:glycosyl hydrolase family 28-related protein [Massilibacteroides vaginae]